MTENEALSHKVDRSKWLPGPWDSEPDRVDFEHAGYACLLLRSEVGHWCGYVGVGPDHLAHGKGYDDVPVEVHGGLTYADKCYPPICHVPKPGMPEDVWWLGFDTAHAGDCSPELRRNFFGGTYKTVEYVREETRRLAEQLQST